MNFSVQSRLSRIQLACLVIGASASLATVAGAFIDRKQFYFCWLFACLFWLGLSLGCLLITMIHQLTGGRWGYPTRRIFEAGFMALPLMIVLFIPVFFGLSYLYPWAQPAELAHDPVLQQRHSYQNAFGFIFRAAFFFVVVMWLAPPPPRFSLAQDATTDAAPTRKARTLSGPAIVFYSILATFVYVDWIMSLENHWHSTMFAVIILIGQILVAYAFAILMVALLRKADPLATALSTTHYHHLGNLLLTFVLFWTYISFGQLLVIYSADLPHEIEWYLHRIAGDWKAVLATLAIFHFFVPFYLLLFRAVKKHASPLTILAAIIFLMHILDAYWLVMPAFHQHGVALSWLDFTAPIGIGGLWLAFFFRNLKSAALLPRHDPGTQFAFVYAH